MAEKHLATLLLLYKYKAGVGGHSNRLLHSEVLLLSSSSLLVSFGFFALKFFFTCHVSLSCFTVCFSLCSRAFVCFLSMFFIRHQTATDCRRLSGLSSAVVFLSVFLFVCVFNIWASSEMLSELDVWDQTSSLLHAYRIYLPAFTFQHPLWETLQRNRKWGGVLLSFKGFLTSASVTGSCLLCFWSFFLPLVQRVFVGPGGSDLLFLVSLQLLAAAGASSSLTNGSLQRWSGSWEFHCVWNQPLIKKIKSWPSLGLFSPASCLFQSKVQEFYFPQIFHTIRLQSATLMMIHISIFWGFSSQFQVFYYKSHNPSLCAQTF